MIKDKRNINTTQRFKDPEYWPFRTVGGIVSNDNPLFTGVAQEGWELIFGTEFVTEEGWGNSPDPTFSLASEEDWD